MRFLGANPIDVLLPVHKLQNTDKKIADWTRYMQYRVPKSHELSSVKNCHRVSVQKGATTSLLVAILSSS
jgi:hypothetical protein